MKRKFNYPFKHGGALTAADMNVIGDLMRTLGWIDERGYVIGELGAIQGVQGATGPQGVQGATGPALEIQWELLNGKE